MTPDELDAINRPVMPASARDNTRRMLERIQAAQSRDVPKPVRPTFPNQYSTVPMDSNHDLKTTVAGFLAALFALLTALGVRLDGVEWLMPVLSAVCVAVLGFFTNKKPA